MSRPTQVPRTDVPQRAGWPVGAHLQLVEGSRRGSQRFQAVWDAEALVERRMRRARGEVVVSSGQPSAGLLLVRTGSCKSSITGSHGAEQIIAYHIAGETFGAGAICGGTHDATVTALENSEFWLIPFDRLAAAAHGDAPLQRRLCELLSHEIARDRKAIVMLGTMRAEQRLAAFMLDLAVRYGANGYSSHEFVLRMTRAEIGLHLGLSVETVSRLFSRMHQEGLIHVRGRSVAILDREVLRELLNAQSRGTLRNP